MTFYNLNLMFSGKFLVGNFQELIYWDFKEKCFNWAFGAKLLSVILKKTVGKPQHQKVLWTHLHRMVTVVNDPNHSARAGLEGRRRQIVGINDWWLPVPTSSPSLIARWRIPWMKQKPTKVDAKIPSKSRRDHNLTKLRSFSRSWQALIEKIIENY